MSSKSFIRIITSKMKEKNIEEVILYEIEANKGTTMKSLYNKISSSFEDEKIENALGKLESKGLIKKKSDETLYCPKEEPYEVSKKHIKERSTILVKKLLSATKQDELFSEELADGEKDELKEVANSLGLNKSLVTKFNKEYFAGNYPASMQFYKGLNQVSKDIREILKLPENEN